MAVAGLILLVMAAVVGATPRWRWDGDVRVALAQVLVVVGIGLIGAGFVSWTFEP